MKKLVWFLPFLLLFIVISVEAPTFFLQYPKVLNFGDVMLDRGVRNIIENRGRDPFEYIKKDSELIRPYDVVIANLEGPIIETSRANCQNKEFNFQFASDTPASLKSAGITMVNIANNHANDCFAKGYESTRNYLALAGIPYMGDTDLEKSYIVKTIHGKKIAFLGIDETIAPIPVENFYPLVKKLKSENDYVLVNIHWGTEYELGFTEVQQAIGHALIDNGADVIFGHHPHVIEPAEVYKGKAIFYSLGNFVFDQTGEEETKGFGAGVELRDDKMIFNLLPYRIKVFAPEFMKGDEKENFCEQFLKGLEHNDCNFEILK